MRKGVRMSGGMRGRSAFRVSIASAAGFEAQYFRAYRGVIHPLTWGTRGPNRLGCCALVSSIGTSSIVGLSVGLAFLL